MKIEDILECSPEQLKAMSDEELLAHFAPFLPTTRPELAPRPSQKSTSNLYSPEELNVFKLKLAKLKALGVEVDEQALLKKMFPKK